MTPPRPFRLTVLASGSGSNLQALLDAETETGFGAKVVGVVSDRPGVTALDRARLHDVPAAVVEVGAFPDRAAWDKALTEACAEHEPDLVVSAGFLKLVGPVFLERFGGRYVNTHNALLPAFPGIHGPRDALAYGVKVTGATLHFVDAGIDTGPIIAQVVVPVLAGDTEQTLTERIKVAERRQLVDTVGALAREGWKIDGRNVIIGG